MLIRGIRDGEEEALWELLWGLDHETPFMMYEPGERKKNTERLKNLIKQSVEGPDLLLVAEQDKGEGLVGFLSADRGGPDRIHHTAYLVTGIRHAYCGQGIGTQFFADAERWAMDQGITRLELTVVCSNEAAVHLYQKCGFQIEGRRRCSMCYEGRYEDEYYMAKLLNMETESTCHAVMTGKTGAEELYGII